MRAKKTQIVRGRRAPALRVAEVEKPKPEGSERAATTSAAKRPTNSPARRGGAPRPRPPSTAAIASEARLLRVEPGLHSLAIAAFRNPPRELAGMTLPAVLVTVPRSGTGDAVELIGVRADGAWIDAAGGVVIMRAPAAGGNVLLTSYSPLGEAAMPLEIKLQPVDAAAMTPGRARRARTARRNRPSYRARR